MSDFSEMDSPTPPKASKNAYHIGGVEVEFPHKPYGSQLAFMGRVISTLDRAQRDGHCHALLESPTGTGKSLSLLCSVLAWHKKRGSKNVDLDPANLKAAPEARTDPIGYGGGFLPETQPSANPEPTPSAANGKASKKKTSPTIYYATRTHSQITQVIREYKKTTYRVPMAVLASRKHYCTNKNVCGRDNVDEQCKLLLKDHQGGCSEFKNVHKVKGHPSLKKGGCHEVHDIEDLVKVGEEMKGCSYYAARALAEDAQLVFCPYSYIVNPVIRKAMEVDIKGAIIILDEAHNIEDIARDGGSVDIDFDILTDLGRELGTLACEDPLTYEPLREMTSGIIDWMQDRKNSLEKREFQRHFSCWSGDKALRELKDAEVKQDFFPMLQECAVKAIKAASDKEEGESNHLTGMSATTLEGLFSSLTYFFSGNGAHINDYVLSLQHHVKRGYGNTSSEWTYTLSLWCLNPAVVFRDIADRSLSVILTSGTLSPMDTFSSELGVQFGTCLEAPHVIDVDSQVWAAVIPAGPSNYPLNASYKTADGYAFQDELGLSLEEICKTVPGGSLIFFPSYRLMEKLCNRWRETGQWARLNARKPLFVEPRGQDDFESALTGYYSAIRKSQATLGRKRRTRRLGVGNGHPTDGTEKPSKDGAAFLAVCRGKVSEGIDFSDENARVVIIVGIPFPNIYDIQVEQKKRYNDTFRSSKNLLSGSQWYCHQAFRALNQAAGRCIRHKFDYGAIILLDERFREERNVANISKWLKKSIRQYDSFGKSVEHLGSFFQDVKERFGKDVNVEIQNSNPNVEIAPVESQGKVFTQRRNRKERKSNKCESNVACNSVMDMYRRVQLRESEARLTKCFVAPSKSIVEDGDEVHELPLTGENFASSSKEHLLEESSFHKDIRSPGSLSMAYYLEDPDISFVKETPCINLTSASPRSFSKDEAPNSKVIQAPVEFSDELHYTSPGDSNLDPRSTYSLAATPNKCSNTNSPAESVFNVSVNSHTQKRRRYSGPALVSRILPETFDAPHLRTPENISFVESTTTSIDANGRSELGQDEVMMSIIPASKNLMDERLQIFCSLCKNPLGLNENHLFVRCFITSSSKAHLVSLMKDRVKASPTSTLTDVPVLVADTSSIDQRVYNGASGGTLGKGVWCKEDGCVFSTIFCPFCSSNLDHCIGVKVMATDSSNTPLLDKMIFFVNCLEIQNLEPKTEKINQFMTQMQELSPPQVSGTREVPISIENFSYKSPRQNSDGWRTTKSQQIRLAKRGVKPNSRG